MQTSRELCTVDTTAEIDPRKRKRAVRIAKAYQRQKIASDAQRRKSGDNPPQETSNSSAESGDDIDERLTSAKLQYPLEHYQASLGQMQAANYPLPLNTVDGAKVNPRGFVASHQAGAACLLLLLAS